MSCTRKLLRLFWLKNIAHRRENSLLCQYRVNLRVSQTCLRVNVTNFQPGREIAKKRKI